MSQPVHHWAELLQQSCATAPEIAALPYVAGPVDRPHVVCVWDAHVGECPYDTEDLVKLLDTDERLRAGRQQRSGARRRYVVTHAFLRAVLGIHLQMDPANIGIVRGRFGKPAIERSAGMPDIRFNMSHADDLAVCAIAIGREVGVDIAQIKPGIDIDGIARLFFAPAEYQALLALSGKRRWDAFYACWTRKEAYIKALGTGLMLPLDSFHVSIDPDELDWSLEVEGGDSTEVVRWARHSFAPRPDYAGAIAIETLGAAVDLSFRRVR